MAITLQNFNPGVSIGGDSGRWLVVFCGRTFRAQRYESFYEARRSAREGCTVCSDGKSHRLIELEPAMAVPVKPARRFREIGWD